LIGKHVAAATNTITLQLLLEAAFPFGPFEVVIRKTIGGDPLICKLTISL
jgi:hypothetical protein